MYEGKSEYMPGNCATQRALNTSPKGKAASSPCLYDASVLPSAVIGSWPTQCAKSESNNSEEVDFVLQKAVGR